jgi:hypothetical protein
MEVLAPDYDPPKPYLSIIPYISGNAMTENKKASALSRGEG